MISIIPVNDSLLMFAVIQRVKKEDLKNGGIHSNQQTDKHDDA